MDTQHNTQHDVRKLSGLDDWQLEDSGEDLRGKTLMTNDGREIGEIDDMLADRDAERVVALRLADGRVVNIDSVDMRDGVPVLIVDQTTVPATKLGRGEATSEHIPIVEERMLIGKKQVELGKVRISTRVVSKDVGEDVTLRTERVNVERHKLNEPVSAAAANTLFKDGKVELAETAERAVVSKEAVVTGDVVVDKDIDTRTERVEGTVRHTEVDVDRDTLTTKR